MAEYVVAQAAVLIVPTLGKGPNSFQVQLEKELKKVQKSFDVEMRADTTKLVAQGLAAKKLLEQDPVNVRFRIVDATKQITEIRQKYEDIAREMKKGLFLNLKIVGMSVLPQLAAGLAAVNASMVDLTKSALLLPGILAGVASSVATIATGLGGVKEAFKEYSDGQKNAAQEGLKARNSAKNMQNAYRDLGRSIKDAKRNLEDLNAELRGAPLDEADAIIAVAEARQEAADRAGKSGLQQQKDTLALMRAENALVDVRLRNSRLIQDAAEANAKGVAGSDAVTEATERLSKATDEANTQTTKLSDSLKELSPNAQSFVKAITGMTDEWAAFKNATQDRLFAGLDQEITQLAEVSLPTLQRGFGAIADSLNGNVKAAFKAIESETNQGFLDKIFGDTASAQANLSKAFDPFIDSLLRLSATGTDFLPRLVDGLVDLTTRFDNFIVRAEADGSLDKWINQGIDEFKALGNSIINVGSMLNSLSEAFTGSGGQTFLQVLEDGSKKLADFMDSAEGQEQLKRFFTDAREEFRKWGPLLDQLPGLMANLAQAGQQWANLLLPFLTSAGTLLAQHPGLVKLIFSAYVGWKTIVPVVKSLKNGIEMLSKATGLLNEVLFSGATGHIGKFAAATDNMKSKVGSLTSAIAGPAGLTAMATALGGYLAYSLVDAHDEASAAAQRQKSDLDDLTTSLTNVTGAATAATNALVAKNFREGQNAATGKSYGDLLNTVLPDAGQQTDLTQRVGAGDLAGALAMVPGAADAAAIEKTDLWKYYAQNLKDAGLNSDLVARAVNGDPAAKEKFDKWIVEERRRKASNVLPFSGSMSPEVLSGLETGNVIASTPDLLDIQEMLPQDMRDRSRVQNEIYANTTQIQQGSADTRLDNERAQGAFQLPAGSPFSALGVLVQPGVGANREGELLTSSAPPEGSALAEQFRNDGVTFRQDGPGRFIVSLTPEAAAKYFVPRYASGGMVSGPGSGTSDSIMARLSAGEYVINAASTKKHLPLLEQINGGNVPGFAEGGLFGNAGSAGSGIASPPQKPRFDLNNPNPLTANYAPQSLMGSAGQANAAEIDAGSKIVSPPIPKKPGLLEQIGNSAYAGLGLYKITGSAPPEGYQSVSAATLSTRGSAWEGLNSYGTTGAPGTPFTTDTYLNDILGANKPKPVVTPTKAPPSAPTKTSGGTVATSTDSRVNPSTTVHGGSKPSAGPGNTVPHQVAGLPARPGPYQAPVISQNTSQIAASTGLPPSVVTSSVPSSLLATPVVGPLAAEAAYQLAAYEGLPKGSAINYGQAGFPDWVYQVGAPFGMVASTYAGHQEGGGTNKGIDWAPDGVSWNTPQGAEMMTRYAKYLASLGIMEQVIYKNPFTGETVGVANGQMVGPGTDQPQYYAADWDGHMDHIHTRQSKVIPTPAQLQSMGISPGGSPSNIAMAGTPTGVQLPQLSYAPGGGSAGGQGSGAAGGGMRMPTPEEYAKYVSDSWQSTLQDMVQNAGQIAIGFLGSFLGLDLSKITGLANSVMGGVDLPGAGDGEGGSSGVASTMDAIPSVDQIMQAAQSLPPGYQEQYIAAATQNPAQAGAMLDEMMKAAQGGGSGAGSVQYDPSKGAEQWRPLVRATLKARAAQYGITNLQAWEDALVRQIQTESNGNPNVDNLNDSDGQGGTQQVFGLGQFLPTTFAAHNVTGGDIRDPAAVIPAMIDYVATKYGMDSSGAPKQIGRGVGYASGGMVKGMGSGKSDSMIARVSNGEYVVKAAQARKHMGLLDAINGGRTPGFAEGGPIINPMFPPPPPPPIPPVTTPPPPPAPVPPDPGGPAADMNAGMPTAPAPAVPAVDQAQADLQEAGATVGGIGEAVSGVVDGASAPAGGNPEGDPRSALMAAPQTMEHNKPAIQQGITQAAGAIAGAVSTAISAAGAGVGGPAGGAAGGAASAPISGLITAGGTAVAGAVNILSSLGVGTLTPSTTTAGAYGAPMLPETKGQQPYSGPGVVNNWNGGVHTTNNEEFFKVQQRKELQNASPYLPQR